LIVFVYEPFLYEYSTTPLWLTLTVLLSFSDQHGGVDMAPVSDGPTAVRTVFVTIRTRGNERDVELPGDIPIRSLLPLLNQLFDIESADASSHEVWEWGIGPEDGAPFDPKQTLVQCGVVDGAILHLAPLKEWESRSQQSAPSSGEPFVIPDDGKSPQERTKAVLPQSYSFVNRLAEVTRAVFLKSEPDSEITAADLETIVASASSENLRKPLSPSALTIQKRTSTMERVRRAWRRTNYIHLLDQAIAKPQLQRCATIAVVSPKGGVGKTTITALLGTLLAAVRRDRIVAIDTNPDFGSLGRTLAPDHQVFVDDLLTLLDSTALTVTTLDANLGRAAHGLMVLPAPTDPIRMAKLDEAAYTRVVNRLRELVGVVILDCGTGLQDPASRAALHTADQIVLVSDSQPATASLVAEAVALLEQEGKPMWLVINKMPRRGSQLNVRALNSFVPKARGLLTLPSEEKAANRVSGGKFDWRDAPKSWQQAVRELAVALTAEWNHLHIAK
jgi:MinD-like ATPase involved in chromosome partitioning or flagellar assembly